MATTTKRSYRTQLGQFFSEGSVLLWKATGRYEGGREELTRKLGIARGMLSTWLYGDRRPGIDKAVMLAKVLKIPVAAWLAVPSEPFSPPAMLEPPVAPASSPRLRPLAKTRVRKAAS